MKHNRLSMKHFSYTMANKMSDYTKFEFICMIPSKIKCLKYQHADESMTRSLQKE
jgi:hypothetical protein